MIGRRYWDLTLADWAILVAAILLDASFLLPWLSLLGYTLRPADLLGTWALIGLLVLIVSSVVVAGRWPYTRWLGLVPLVGGCLLLGVLFGVLAAVLVLNPLLARLPLEEANNLVQTVSRLAGLLRLSSREIEALSEATGRFAAEPQASFKGGVWLFAAGALGLIVAGYQKVVQCFSRAAESE